MVLLGPGSIAKAILAQIFSGSSPEKLTAVAGAVGKVKIPRRLRDFQVRCKSPAFGLFPEPLFPRPFYPPRVQSRKYTEGECYDQEAIPAHARAGPPKTFRRPARPWEVVETICFQLWSLQPRVAGSLLAARTRLQEVTIRRAPHPGSPGHRWAAAACVFARSVFSMSRSRDGQPSCE